MKIFAKRETITQNITFMAIIAAINVLIAVIIAFTWSFAAILTIFLPFLSASVALFCKKKYYPIYLVATVLLSVVTTLWNLDTTLFYVLPAIFTGFIFGLFSELKIHPILTIGLASLIQLGLTYISILIINAVYQIDIINNLLTLVKLETNELAISLVPSIIFLFSVVQILLSYIIFKNEYKKIDNTEQTEKISYALFGSIIGVALIVLIITYFFSLKAAYLMASIIIYVGIGVLVIDMINLRKIVLLLDLISIIISIILFAVFYPLMKENSGVLLVILFPMLTFIVSLICSFLKKRDTKDKINDARE